MLIKDQFVRTRVQDNAHKSKQRLPNGQRLDDSPRKICDERHYHPPTALGPKDMQFSAAKRTKEAIRNAKDLRARMCEAPEPAAAFNTYTPVAPRPSCTAHGDGDGDGDGVTGLHLGQKSGKVAQSGRPGCLRPSRLAFLRFANREEIGEKPTAGCPDLEQD
uniref:HDC19389 n=1 Tax=Drosophila melanogaster TaxID=7227 RepID=Q6II92_DROME|nr:TPA_inf: HDC19389 [Drosophila melanogaster]